MNKCQREVLYQNTSSDSQGNKKMKELSRKNPLSLKIQDKKKEKLEAGESHTAWCFSHGNKSNRARWHSAAQIAFIVPCHVNHALVPVERSELAVKLRFPFSRHPCVFTSPISEAALTPNQEGHLRTHSGWNLWDRFRAEPKVLLICNMDTGKRPSSLLMHWVLICKPRVWTVLTLWVCDKNRVQKEKVVCLAHALGNVGLIHSFSGAQLFT